MFIVNPQIEEYIQNLTESIKFDNDILLQMEEYGRQTNFPIVERKVGVLLYIITKIKKPKLVVEMGSGYGYSAYFFAKAIDHGKVVLTDFQQKNIDMAKNYFEKAGLLDKAEFRVGNALEIVKEYKNIDILFLDLEKVKYFEAIKLMENNLSDNGLVIADNVLWYGNVVLENIDKKTEVIKEFNRYMFESGKFISQIVPIRDGVLIGLKV
ncbi:MAG: O-methyltransferase [Hydrogenothermaceae bacterium]